MKETGYHEAMKKEYENRVALKVKRQRMTDEERSKALIVRRKLEDIKEAKAIRQSFEF